MTVDEALSAEGGHDSLMNFVSVIWTIIATVEAIDRYAMNASDTKE